MVFGSIYDRTDITNIALILPPTLQKVKNIWEITISFPFEIKS